MPKTREAEGEGRPKKSVGLKAHRFKSAQGESKTPSLLRELVELNRYVAYLLPEGPHYLRPFLLAQRARLRSFEQPTASDVAQMVAEEDGDAIED